MGDELRVRPERTPIDHEELRAALARAWRELRAEEPSSDTISILLAQASLETDRGRKSWNWNIGGVKASVAVLHTYYPTVERWPRERAERDVNASTPLAPCRFVGKDDGGAFREVLYSASHPMCRFAAYSDLATSALAYLGLLSRRYATALDAAVAGDPIAFVASLSKAGYFTAPGAKYGAAVVGLFDEFREPCLSSAAEIGGALERVGFGDVKAFQRDAGLRDDGVVGRATRDKLRNRLSGLASK